ncbi:hypothetical protein Poly51_34410 [Rubripirellula tenax]|uniref:Uncharacterized protein n=1 Tax=Rubripirellula tenax TaxID=2528015 RepID=A0A5C6F0B4_9BACT|nr:hypothetical protein Poly51_34410 [Rubripirellula tenax]
MNPPMFVLFYASAISLVANYPNETLAIACVLTLWRMSRS